MFGVASRSFVFFLMRWRDASRREKSNRFSHGSRRSRAESLGNDIFHLDITRHTSRYCPLPGFCLQSRETFTADKHTRPSCLQTEAKNHQEWICHPDSWAKLTMLFNKPIIACGYEYLHLNFSISSVLGCELYKHNLWRNGTAEK